MKQLSPHITSLQLLSDSVCKKLGREKDWWFYELLNHSYFDTFSETTGTNFGLLWSFDADSLDTTRIFAHVNPSFPLQDFFTKHARAHPCFAEIRHTMQQCEDVGIADSVGYGFGLAATKHAENVNFYIGLNSVENASRVVHAFAKMDFWMGERSGITSEIISRIATSGYLTGLSKRYGEKEGIMFYFASTCRLSRESLAHILHPYQELLHEQVLHALEVDQINFSHGEQLFGWAIALDSQGNIPYVKLEIASGIDFQVAMQHEPSLFNEVEKLTQLGASLDLNVVPHLVSYRIHRHRVSKTVYCGLNAIYDA